MQGCELLLLRYICLKGHPIIDIQCTCNLTDNSEMTRVYLNICVTNYSDTRFENPKRNWQCTCNT